MSETEFFKDCGVSWKSSLHRIDKFVSDFSVKNYRMFEQDFRRN